jgi:hypothetical protein
MSFHKHFIYAVPILYVRLSLEWIPIIVSNRRLILCTHRMFQDAFEVGKSKFPHTHAFRWCIWFVWGVRLANYKHFWYIFNGS